MLGFGVYGLGFRAQGRNSAAGAEEEEVAKPKPGGKKTEAQAVAGCGEGSIVLEGAEEVREGFRPCSAAAALLRLFRVVGAFGFSVPGVGIQASLLLKL